MSAAAKRRAARKVFYIKYIFIEFIAEGKFMIPPCGAHGVDKFQISYLRIAVRRN